MDVNNLDVYHTILQNQNHCLEIELKNVIHLRLWAQTMRVQFIIKPKIKVNSKHIPLLFSGSVTRTAHIELLSNLTTTAFIKSFKRLISRRGKPKIVYSENAKTFETWVKWLVIIDKETNKSFFIEVRRLCGISTFLKHHGWVVNLNR